MGLPPSRRFPRVVTTCAVLVVLGTALLGAATAAPTANAAHTVQFGLTDDAWLTYGPSGTVASRVATLKSLGVKVVRYTLDWNVIAKNRPAAGANPNDPAYDWTDDDTVLDALHAARITVVLQLLGTPSWANGGRGSNYAPTSASTFGNFAKAAALRYPWVTHWLIWNEPNQVRWLRPTTPAVYTSRLLNPAYAAIHATIRGALVGGGVTAPRGVTGGVSPVAWIAGMRAAHAHLDAYAHDPYPLDPKLESPLAGGCTHCLTITMATIGKLVTLVDRDFPAAQIWLTEYGYQTNPPDDLLGVSPALQARYIGEAAYQAYRTPKVTMLIQFLYRDEPTLSRFQSGLVTVGNVKKPAYAAFRIPLAELARSGSTVSLWGQLRAPAATTSVRLERLVGKRWTTITVVHAKSGGFFSARVRAPAKAWVRVVDGTLVGAEIQIA